MEHVRVRMKVCKCGLEGSQVRNEGFVQLAEDGW
jgi:hypothetical protein